MFLDENNQAKVLLLMSVDDLILIIIKRRENLHGNSIVNCRMKIVCILTMMEKIAWTMTRYT